MSQDTSQTCARVRVELGEITRITLDRQPQANALDWRMGEELEAAMTLIRSTADVRVVVLTGAGKHFSSGGDFGFLEENTKLPREQVAARMLRFYQMFLGVVELPVPTVAVLRGSAIGAGLCLALACDLRVGSLSGRYGMNFLRVGLHPGMGATALLPHVVGTARASQLVFSCETLDGEQAARLGLLTDSVSEGELDAAGERLAREVARGAPLAAREAVETLRGPLRAALPGALSREASCQAEDFGTEDVKRAIEAFRHKRAPLFVGR